MEITRDCFFQELAPKEFSFLVRHNQDISDQIARSTDCQIWSFVFLGIHKALITERSPGDGDFYTADCVVDDFESAEGGNSKSPHIPIERDTEDTFTFQVPKRCSK